MFDALTEEQINIIKRFWTNFNPEKLTYQKMEFKSIWSILNDLYQGFRKSLKEKNLAYEGMIFRDVAENSGEENSAAKGWEMIHFIGFNALNECERKLMIRLKKEGKARFYWDYDNSYIKGPWLNSAGYFLRDNLQIFGNDMPGGWSYETILSRHLASGKHRIIETSSDLAQVKLIPELIREIPYLTPENAHETAIILADENLLIPVLTSLPEDIPDINITMGYPLRHTSVYILVKHLLDMQRNVIVQNGAILFRHRDVISILKNSLISDLMNESDHKIIKNLIESNLLMVPSTRFDQSENLSEIFRFPSSPALISGYLKSVLSLIVTNGSETGEVPGDDSVPKNVINEFIYRIIISLNRLDAVTGNPEISFTVGTWISLLDRLLRSQSVPFSGEPLSGIQIMGILETRSLDFKNLIILSVNEGILPVLTTASSFIPFSLREAFHLPSINHQESIYAYHFYRLLQRAENVTFIYNSNPEGLRSGEMSRFLQQMKYEPLLKSEFLNLSYEIRNRSNVNEIIDRTEEHQLQILSRFSLQKNNRILSPSAINTWLNCRMKFYYRYVCGLKEPDGITEEIDPAILGTLLHETMRKIYEGFIGKSIDVESVNTILFDQQVILRLIARTIGELFNRETDTAVSGNELIVNEVLKIYINRVLEIDKSLAPFILLDLEKHVTFPVTIGEDKRGIRITSGGNIDRVDVKDGIIRIVDYKTGSIADSISSISDLFIDDRKKDADVWLQTLLYCEAYLVNKPESVLRPSVYKIKKLTGDLLSDKLILKTDSKSEFVVDNYESVREEFSYGLNGIINKIISDNEPFSMTNDTRGKCPFCPYKSLCMR
jgi:CRISPR/Cas system-associated exonuclease Cas4 (RecB family)